MYASLVTAGASALYDLYKSATSKTGSTDAASSSTASDQSSAATDAGTIGAAGSTSTSGSKFSDALNKLFTDLQSSATGATSTSTVAGDLQSLSKGLKTGGAHGGHHHGGAPPATNAQSTDDPSSSSPFQGLASSLVAYAKTQSLGASTSTSLTA